MASYKYFLGLALAAVAISMATAQLSLLPAEVSQVIGRLVCTPTGNVIPGTANRGIAGVNVHVTCNQGTIDLGTIVTNKTGFFDGVLRTAGGLLFIPSTCVASVNLPILGCDVLPPTGILQSLLGPGGVIDNLINGVLQLVTGVWTIVAV